MKYCILVILEVSFSEYSIGLAFSFSSLKLSFHYLLQSDVCLWGSSLAAFMICSLSLVINIILTLCFSTGFFPCFLNMCLLNFLDLSFTIFIKLKISAQKTQKHCCKLLLLEWTVVHWMNSQWSHGKLCILFMFQVFHQVGFFHFKWKEITQF